MSGHSRRILTPGATGKRKEREAFYTAKQPTLTAPIPAPVAATAATKVTEPVSSNQLLAGYMAYEFLTKGTLFGQNFDPARAEAVPLGGSSAESKRIKSEAEPGTKEDHRSYAEVANILKNDGPHIPGIVNPTQLAQWIQCESRRRGKM